MEDTHNLAYSGRPRRPWCQRQER